MDTLRIARDFGDVSAILPTGITSLHDLPHNIHDDIRTGMSYLRFQEMSDDEAPPKRIWTDGEALTSHFERVRREMESRYGSSDSSSGEEQRNPAASSLLVE